MENSSVVDRGGVGQAMELSCVMNVMVDTGLHELAQVQGCVHSKGWILQYIDQEIFFFFSFFFCKSQ